MRRLFLILMIALLPLRAWASDVMAIEMATGAPAASAQAPQTPDLSGAATMAHHQMPAASDCEGHAGTSSTEAAAQAHCNTCVTCQICHSAVVLAQALGVTPPVLPPPAPAIGAPRFSSAERALSQKPPIS